MDLSIEIIDYDVRELIECFDPEQLDDADWRVVCLVCAKGMDQVVHPSKFGQLTPYFDRKLNGNLLAWPKYHKSAECAMKLRRNLPKYVLISGDKLGWGTYIPPEYTEFYAPQLSTLDTLEEAITLAFGKCVLAGVYNE